MATNPTKTPGAAAGPQGGAQDERAPDAEDKPSAKKAASGKAAAGPESVAGETLAGETLAAETLAAEAVTDAQAEDAEPAAPAGSGPSVEDLVPGLDDAIAAEDAAQGMAAEERLRAEIAELTTERDALKERMMRALAEAENVRRRAERDKKDAEAYGGTKLARDLLAVYDNLDRAMKAADDTLRENHGPFLEGVELTRRELLNAFGKHKISSVKPALGEKFDPKWHQAMFEAPVPGAEAGAVIEVMQEGFMIADRLLRPAFVGVAKAAPAPAETPAEAASDTPPED